MSNFSRKTLWDRSKFRFWLVLVSCTGLHFQCFQFYIVDLLVLVLVCTGNQASPVWGTSPLPSRGWYRQNSQGPSASLICLRSMILMKTSLFLKTFLNSQRISPMLTLQELSQYFPKVATPMGDQVTKTPPDVLSNSCSTSPALAVCSILPLLFWITYVLIHARKTYLFLPGSRVLTPEDLCQGARSFLGSDHQLRKVPRPSWSSLWLSHTNSWGIISNIKHFIKSICFKLEQLSFFLCIFLITSRYYTIWLSWIATICAGTKMILKGFFPYFVSL